MKSKNKLHLGVTLFLSYCYLQVYGCPNECVCENGTAHCRGYSLPNVVNNLPDNTTRFQYEAMEMEVDLGASNFSHLANLEYLEINEVYNYMVQDRIIMELYDDQQAVFHNLTNLKELHINIRWEFNEPLDDIFKHLDSLEVLDLSYTRRIHYTSLISAFQKAFVDNCSISVFRLRHSQTLNSRVNGLVLDLHKLLKPLQNCPLRELDISYNSFQAIVPGTLAYAKNLTTIIASNNLLDPLLPTAFFFEVILHPSIVYADLKQQLYALLKTQVDTFSRKRNKRETTPKNAFLQSANQCFQKVTNYDFCAFTLPECIKYFNLWKNNHTLFCEILYLALDDSFAGIPCEYIPGIDKLIDPSCGGCLRVWTEGNIKQLYINQINSYDELFIYPSFINKTQCFGGNTIEFVDYSCDPRIHSFYRAANDYWKSNLIGFEYLKVLNLSYCYITDMHPDQGKSLPSLEVGAFSNNRLSTSDRINFIKGAKKLRHLDLSNNEIKELSSTQFDGLYNLELLNLSNNNLNDFNLKLQDNTSLNYIDLSRNSLSYLSKAVTKELSLLASRLVNKTLKINLSQNELLCTCNEMDFVEWMLKSNNNINFVNFGNYSCTNEKSILVQMKNVKISAMKGGCHTKWFYIWLSLGITVPLFLILFLIIVIIYKKRWWCRYNFYLARKMLHNIHSRDMAAQRFEYEAFISYSSKDDDWVMDELQPKLEEEFELRLCLHHRDFPPGGLITDQIINAIEKSHKTLIILTPSFIKSTWCQFEMQMAQNKLFQAGVDVIIPVILRPLQKINSKSLKALLERHTYIEWTDDEFGQKLFWNKLRDAIKGPYNEEYGMGESQPLLN